MKRVLIVLTQAPYASAAGQEGLDAIFAACALGIEVNVLFLDDGVFLLNKEQPNLETALRRYPKGFKALPDFGVAQIAVELQSLSARGLCEGDLIVNPLCMNGQRVGHWINQHDRVFAF